MSDDVSVAVIGLGFGANHARVLEELPGARLVAVVDSDEERLAAAVPGSNTARYTDAPEMLKEMHPDAVAGDATEFARRSRISVDINRARDIIVEHRSRTAGARAA